MLSSEPTVAVIDRVAPWTCLVCGVLVLDYEEHTHLAQDWVKVQYDVGAANAHLGVR